MPCPSGSSLRNIRPFSRVGVGIGDFDRERMHAGLAGDFQRLPLGRPGRAGSHKQSDENESGPPQGAHALAFTRTIGERQWRKSARWISARPDRASRRRDEPRPPSDPSVPARSGPERSAPAAVRRGHSGAKSPCARRCRACRPLGSGSRSRASRLNHLTWARSSPLVGMHGDMGAWRRHLRRVHRGRFIHAENTKCLQALGALQRLRIPRGRLHRRFGSRRGAGR